MRLSLVPLLVLLVAGCGSNNSGGGSKSDAGVGGNGPVTTPSDMAMSQNPQPGADMVSTGASCLATAMCAQMAKTQTDILKCLEAASPKAQQEFNALLECFDTQCGKALPDAGTGPCDSQQQCSLCVETGTSPTGNTINGLPCLNSQQQGAQPVSDPKCGMCVDQFGTCLADG
jgi:hypothetical protein